MWDEVAKEIESFPTAVLTTVDDDGYPFSLRCRARFDASRQVIELDVPAGREVAPGPADLLWHRHDLKLWNLREFVVQGDLERGAAGWTLRPMRLLGGQGAGGLLGQLRSVTRYRKTAARYLAKRGLARPAVDWDSVNRLRDEANAMERGR
jgi:hypothetical protein